MQHQLKSCGDVKTPRAVNGHRRSGAAAAKKTVGNGTGSSFLATDVTNLDMNSNFLSKKLKRNPNGVVGGANMAVSNVFMGAQLVNNGMNFAQAFNPTSLYNNAEFHLAMASGDLPPLMGVSPYKHQSLLQNIDPSMDMSQFTEELNAIQNMPFNPLSSPALQSLFAGSDPTCASSFMSMQKPNMLPSSTIRVSGARKNRIVEVKTVNDRSAIIVTDPQASASARPVVIPMNRPFMGVAQSCIEASKSRPISPEPLYSRKVFIGGLPIDVTDEEVWATFGSFGKVLIDWPRRPEHNNHRGGDVYEMENGRRNLRSVSGYVFLVFTNERSVQELVNACEFYDNKFYLELSSPTMNDKAVQVRPWRLSDIDYFCDEGASVDHRRTVFIGGVPRPTRACDLANSLENYYGKVSYVGIDIDPELKYPKGAARVTFATAQSFVRAISGRFVQVTHAENNKRVEIKPYVMEDQHCDECLGLLCKHNYAPYFCGDASCLQYYCEACWDRMHYEMCSIRSDHRPMVRTGDQTRILPRPPHHPTSHYHHRQQHQMVQQDPNMSHHSGHPSMISRIVNRNAMIDNNQPAKPFSATPATIGY